MDKLVKLFTSFLKIGAFTFGGGYAMLPLIHQEAVEKQGWITENDILDILAIAEATPGVLAVNTATFVGWRVAGFWGATAATVGVALPSFVIISLVAAFYWQVRHNVWIDRAFVGIRAAVVVLMGLSVTKLGKMLPGKAFHWLVGIGALLAVVLLDANPVLVLLAAGLLGLVCAPKKPQQKGNDHAA